MYVKLQIPFMEAYFTNLTLNKFKYRDKKEGSHVYGLSLSEMVGF